MSVASVKSIRKAILRRIAEVTCGAMWRKFSSSQRTIKSQLGVKKPVWKAPVQSILSRLNCTRTMQLNSSLLTTIDRLILMVLKKLLVKTNSTIHRSMVTSPCRSDLAFQKSPRKSSASAFNTPRIRDGTAFKPRQPSCQTRLKVTMNTTNWSTWLTLTGSAWMSQRNRMFHFRLMTDGTQLIQITPRVGKTSSRRATSDAISIHWRTCSRRHRWAGNSSSVRRSMLTSSATLSRLERTLYLMRFPTNRTKSSDSSETTRSKTSAIPSHTIGAKWSLVSNLSQRSSAKK